ncbi:hypothetical protein TKK_0010593 [Trichogramma kaykai]|uniref:Uncharacterized protein n=1 Tax=Trichogramma kaykai TaxID=54128 RepID=A0ABD2WWZ3_9HYME
MEKLKRLRGSKLDLEKQEDRREFLRKLYPLIENWNDEIPDLGKMFKSDEINWLLIEDVCCENKKAPFVEFVIMAEYRDDPYSDDCAKWVLPSRKRTTAIHVAASQKSPDMALIVKLFGIYDRHDYADEETGLTHLHAACMLAELVPYVALFLDVARSDPNCRVRATGDTPLHFAARHRNEDAVNLLLRYGAEPMTANHLGLSPLHVLCRVDDDDADARLREFLLVCEDERKRLNLDARDGRGDTPLHAALRWGNKRAAKLMLAKGADPLARNDDNLTPLRMTVDLGDRDFAQMFYEMCVEQGRIHYPNLANNNNNDEKEDIFFKIVKVNNERLGELHVAIESHDMVYVDRLVKLGADPNARDSAGRTPLHVICQVDGNGASSLIGESLAALFFETCDEARRGLEIDARDRHGLTPLQWAVARLLPETTELLLQRGADLDNFVFPPSEIFLYDEVSREDRSGLEPRLEIAACAADVCDSLERRGYQWRDGEVATLMERLAQYGLFDRDEYSRRLNESEEFRRHEARLRRLFWPCVLPPYLEKRDYQLPIDRTCELLEGTNCAILWDIYCEVAGLEK